MALVVIELETLVSEQKTLTFLYARKNEEIWGCLAQKTSYKNSKI